MDIIHKTYKLRQIIEGYLDDSENQGAVVGFGGKLNIRPAYQRNFVYDDKKRDAVIDTIMKGYPLNVMYWNDNGDDTYEMIDGQQRTISFCQYCSDNPKAFSINLDGKNDWRKFDALSETLKEKILNYEVNVYICQNGTDDEKLKWFETINISSEPMKPQELRNAQFTGKWLAEAKYYFSRTNGNAVQIAKDYVNGSPNRQEYLETALEWIVDRDNLKSIEEYMGNHRNDDDAEDLWTYFKKVINWVETYFPTKRKIMKGLDWGILYNKYKDNDYNPIALEKEINALLQDDDVTNQKGIYEYLLSGKSKAIERKLSIRAFNEKEKNQLYENQHHKCAKCGKEFSIDELDAHHKIQWANGGHTTIDNGILYCKECHHIEHDNIK